jgi:hypothetical protein
MKNRDQKILERIYESVNYKQRDFLLLENIENFNWSKFWDDYYFCLQNDCFLCESFELTNSDEISDVYEVISSNGIKFELFVNFLPKEKVENYLLGTVYNNLTNSAIKQLQKHFKETDLPILNVNFKDSEGNITTTRKLGVHSFSVIKSIIDGVNLSCKNRLLSQRPDFVFFYILKSEKRKLEFFKNIILHVNPKLNFSFIDQNSNPIYDLAYFATES